MFAFSLEVFPNRAKDSVSGETPKPVGRTAEWQKLGTPLFKTRLQA
jgi:hypothetical protein